MKTLDDLFDALVEEPYCRTYAEIADRMETDEATVNQLLAAIRRPEVSEVHGWMVPHVERGPSDHIFVPILLDDDRPLNVDEKESVRAGAMGTCGQVDALSRNCHHSLTYSGQYLSPEEQELLLDVGAALKVAAKKAAQAKALLAANRWNGGLASS